MTDTNGHQSPVERVIDLTFYAPLGLALTVAEAVPQLARKGRSRLGPQVDIARTVGQFAVKQGFRQFAGFANANGAWPLRAASVLRAPNVLRVSGFGGGAPFWSARKAGRPSGPARSAASPPSAAPTKPSSPGRSTARAPRDGNAGETRSHPGPPASARGRGTASAKPNGEETGAAHLAIPSYDSLSAPQVVQRLAGLSREEVVAVKAYEAATRARRTILARVDQLLV